jgi:anti-sigma B factor antagonist
MSLEVNQSLTDEGFVVLSVFGEVDMASAPEFQGHLTQAAQNGSAVIVDLSSVAFIDSSGLRELHHAADETEVVVVTGANTLVSRIIELTGLRSIVSVCDDIAAAKQELSRRS